MSHAFEVLIDPADAPTDASDRVQTIKDTYRPVLSPDTDGLTEQELHWGELPGDASRGIPKRGRSVLRFHAADDKATILDEITNSAFPNAKWVLVRYHDCNNEYQFSEYRDDPDYPDGVHDDCPDWKNEHERGTVPDALK